MLPLPNLDDRTFKEMVESSRKLIPKIFPEWTDENAHDPGITFIELLAWLTEMQQYHLNQVTDDHERKFLKLLGYEPKIIQPARSHVSFEAVTKETVVPRGTRLLAHQVPFETERSIRLTASAVEKIVVSTSSEANDFTASNNNFTVSFPAFGTEAKKGSSLYIGFDKPLPIKEELSLFIQLHDQYPVPRGAFRSTQDENLFIPSGKVEWHIYSYQQGQQKTPLWMKLKIKKDETNHFSQTGRIVFEIEEEMYPFIVHPANDKNRYWISCTVIEEGFEIPPRVTNVRLNSVPVVQWETKSICLSFDATGDGKQIYQLEDYLAIYGQVQVQVQNEDGDWEYWREVSSFEDLSPTDKVYRMQVNEISKKAVLSFGDGIHGKAPSKGRKNIRVIAYQPTFEKDRMVGKSNGLPNQAFDVRMPILPDQLMLQVGYRPKGKMELIWQDWKMVDDFDLSSSSDRHFTYDHEEGKIIFGNNEQGWVPPKGEDVNIVIISCRIGGGEEGNVNRHTITQLIEPSDDLEGVQVIHDVPATGGRATESLLDVKVQLQQDLLYSDRAITADDFERIAKRTPGLRVGRVKAIPAYVPGLRDYPKQKAQGQVTVVVVPYSFDQKPMPSKGFMQTVKNYLNRHRLLTNHVQVIPPEYVKVTVHAVVVTEPDAKDIVQKIEQRLKQFLKPLNGEDGSLGWEFGKTVFKGDIYGVMNQVPGVTYVQDLWLNAEGIGAVKDDGGNINLPPHGLVVSGEHEIEWMNRHDL